MIIVCLISKMMAVGSSSMVILEKMVKVLIRVTLSKCMNQSFQKFLLVMQFSIGKMIKNDSV